MSATDRLVERAADRLEDLSQTAAETGGPAEKTAPALAEDAEFLRKMTPSKVAARFRGPEGPPMPRETRRGPARRDRGLVLVGAAFLLGILVAKILDWRTYVE